MRVVAIEKRWVSAIRPNAHSVTRSTEGDVGDEAILKSGTAVFDSESGAVGAHLRVGNGRGSGPSPNADNPRTDYP